MPEDQHTDRFLLPAMGYRRAVAQKTGHKGKIGSGHMMMLYGPPGTGKTMTAAVMGKELGVETYAISLSQVASKYIGETEKNIDRFFSGYVAKTVSSSSTSAEARRKGLLTDSPKTKSGRKGRGKRF